MRDDNNHLSKLSYLRKFVAWECDENANGDASKA